MDAARPLRRHLVDQTPAHGGDASRVLCVRGGDGKPVKPGGTPYLHGWTLDRDKVTCPRCLEWMHA